MRVKEPLNFRNTMQTNPFLSSDDYAALARSYGVDPRGNNVLGDLLPRAAIGLWPSASEQITYANSLNPTRESAINQLISWLTPQGQQSQMNRDIAGSNETYNRSAQNSALTARSMGLGDGFQAGLLGSYGTAAAQAANGIRSNYSSPTRQSSLLSALLGAVNQGMQTPALTSELSLFSPIEQRSSANAKGRGSSFLGDLASGALSNLFG